VQIVHQAASLFYETKRVASAMAVRGASGGGKAAWQVLWSLPRVWLPRIVDRADRVADAMELRGYCDGETRTLRSSGCAQPTGPRWRSRLPCSGRPWSSACEVWHERTCSRVSRCERQIRTGSSSDPLGRVVLDSGRRAHCPAWPERFGQNHFAQERGRSRPARRRDPCGRHVLARQTLPKIRERIGFLFNVPEDQILFPRVIDDVAFALVRQGRPRNEVSARATEVLNSLGIGHLAESRSIIFRTVKSNAWRLRGRSWPRRGCFCSMNHPLV